MDSSLTAEKFHARCIVTANIFFVLEFVGGL